MNLYLKYSPITYTIITRIYPQEMIKLDNGSRKVVQKKNINMSKKIMEIGNYIYSLFMRIFPLFVIYHYNNCTFMQLLESIFLYIYNYIIFIIFYEIGYFYNDLCSIKNETHPTLHIEGNTNPYFFYNNIIIRIILGLLLLIPIFFFNQQIGLLFSTIILITQIIYYIHNKIRKYFYNRITLFLLRFSKMVQIFIPMYFLLGTFNSELYLYITVVFLIFQYFYSIFVYGDRFGFNKKNLGLPEGLIIHGYQGLSMIILFIISRNILFLIYGIISLLRFVKTVPKNYFKIENDR